MRGGGGRDGRDRIWPIPHLAKLNWPHLANFFFGGVVGRWVGWCGSPNGGPKISLFFSLSRRKFHSFFSLWGVFSLNFGGVFEGWGAHLSAPALQTPPKFNEKTPQREKKRTNFAAGEKKKSEILGGLGEGRSSGRHHQKS